MSDKNVYDQLVAWVRSILPPNREAATQFFDDPQGVLAAQGFADQDLSGIDISQVVSDACNDPSVPYPVREAAQGYSSSPHPARSFDHTVTQLQQVTTVVYEGDEYFVDNRTTIDVEHLEGDIDIDNVTAQGPGSTAAGDDVNQASGSSQIINGDNFGEATNVGERGVNVDLGATFPTRLGETEPLLTREVGGGLGALGPGGLNISTGDGFAGVQGPSINPVVGDHNTVSNIQGSTLTNSNLNFGDGNTNVTGSPGAVTATGGGDAVNQIGNVVGPGGALAGTGGASGHYEDNDTTNTHVEDNDTTTTTTSTEVETNVTTVSESGDGDQHFIADPIRVPELERTAAAPDSLDGLDDN
jgi:hypothetical protein